MLVRIQLKNTSCLWASSSIGRAAEWHSAGCGFDARLCPPFSYITWCNGSMLKTDIVKTVHTAILCLYLPGTQKVLVRVQL